MRNVLHMAMKDLLLVSRDWLGMFFIIIFPVLMGLFFGSLYGGIGDAGSAKLSLAVVDSDQSPESARFIEAITATGNVEVQNLSRDEAIGRVRRGRLVGMIHIPEGFGETAGIMWMDSPAIELGVDPSRQAESGMLQGLLMRAAGTLMMDRFQNPASMRPMIQSAKENIAEDDNIPAATRPLLVHMLTALESFLESSQAEQSAEQESEVEGEESSTADDGFQIVNIQPIDVTREPEPGSVAALVQKIRSKWDVSFPQAMIWGLLACAASFAISIVRERKQGTLLRLHAAPVSRTQVLLGKATACYLAVLGVIALMVVLGVACGMRPRSPALLVAASLCVAFCFVGIMALMSVLGKTEESVSGAAWGGNMIMAMFGGGMMPLAFMPDFMQTLSHASPVKWSILALEGAIWRGFSPAEMIFPCSVLVGVGAVCLAAGSWRLARSAD